MISISKPFFDNEEINAVKEVLKSGIIAQGPKVEEFEKKFASYIGTKYAIATNNGTTAAHTSLLAHGIGKGDEVITTSFTFISPVNCILFSGAKPVFVDIGEDFNINPDEVEKSITNKTKAIIVTHLYGNPADMKKIIDIAERYNLIVIEDACQAHGAEFAGKKVGSFGTGFFSFYATKNITTGEGGIITTNDSKVVEKAKLIRQHGMKTRYHHEIFGYNYKMTDIQAAIGLVQLKKLDKINMKRTQNANFFNQKLKDIPDIITPKKFPKRKHVWHAYTLRTKNGLSRDKIVKHLNKNEIQTLIYYPIPVHKQKIYEKYSNIKLPMTEKISNEVFSIPVHPSLTSDDLGKIIKTIRDYK